MLVTAALAAVALILPVGDWTSARLTSSRSSSPRLDYGNSWRRSFNGKINPAPSPNAWRSAGSAKAAPAQLVTPDADCTVDELLSRYWNDGEGFVVEDEAELAMIDEHGLAEADDGYRAAVLAEAYGASTYGEVTLDGARSLFAAMGLHEARDAHFFDLGSGVGRLVAQAWLELPEECLASAVGVELSPTRHTAAERAWAALAAGSSTRCRAKGAPEFRLESMLDADLSQATHIYVASLCMPDGVLDALWSRLQESAPKLQVLATLYPMRKAAGRPLEAWREPTRTVQVDMSWTEGDGVGADVYLFEWCTAEGEARSRCSGT